MINKRSYENKENILKDKEKFFNIALKKGYPFLDIQEFIISHYENLKSFDYNLKKLKEYIKNENI